MKVICLFHCTIHFTFQTFPFFGVEPKILNEHGEELEGEAEGYLVSFFSVLHNFIHWFCQPKQITAHISTGNVFEKGKEKRRKYVASITEICRMNLNCEVTETKMFYILWFKQGFFCNVLFS